MKASTAMRALAEIAETQGGLVTTSQSARIGVPRLALSRLAETGDLERIAQGVYRMQGTGVDELTQLRAAWLALDPHRYAAERVANREGAIVVSHRSAAAVHRIGNLYADQHEFTSAERKQSRREGIRVHRSHVGPADVTIAEGMLVTTVERTLVDLVRIEPNPTDVADALADAYHRGRVDLSALAPMLDVAASRHGARSGAELLERMLEYRGLDAASAIRALVLTPALHDALAAVGVAAVHSALEVALQDALSSFVGDIIVDALGAQSLAASAVASATEALRLDSALREPLALLARQAQQLEAADRE